MNEHTVELNQKYVDDAISAEELGDLEAVLQSDPQAAEAFAEATRLHAGLTDLFGEDAAIRDVVELFRNAEAAIEQRRIARRSSMARWFAVAAVLLIAVGGIVWWRASLPSDPNNAQVTHRVVEGDVFTNGKPVSELHSGSSFRIGGTGPAVIQLADGSEAELAPASRGVLREATDTTRQTVELVEGSGTFRVARGEGQFKVKTSIGEVTVLGTEFSVELSSEEGENEMRSAALMAVIVLSGMVQVDVADQSFTLTGGSGRVYAEEGEGAPLVVGQVKAVDASEDTITLAGRKKEGREVVPDQTYAVTAEAAKELGNVKVGNQVTLTLSSDKQSVVRIAVRQPRRDGEGEGAGKPRLRNTGGTFGGTDGDSITILGKGDYKVASDAKIVIETDEDEEYTYRDEEGEHVGTRPKMVEAQLSEFKEKQRVTLRINEEGEAVYVHGHRPKKKRGEGDG